MSYRTQKGVWNEVAKSRTTLTSTCIIGKIFGSNPASASAAMECHRDFCPVQTPTHFDILRNMLEAGTICRPPSVERLWESVNIVLQPAFSYDGRMSCAEVLARPIIEDGTQVSGDALETLMDSVEADPETATDFTLLVLERVNELVAHNNSPIPYNVNVPLSALETPAIFEWLNKHPHLADKLNFEITERVAPPTNEAKRRRVAARLRTLQELGIGIVIDDYVPLDACDYSKIPEQTDGDCNPPYPPVVNNYSHDILELLVIEGVPIAAIKIDRSQIQLTSQRRIVDNAHLKSAIASAKAVLGNAWKGEVVVEGVEHAPGTIDLAQVWNAGATRIQGFGIARPMSPDDYVAQGFGPTHPLN